jgi:hypothetical protein
MTLIGASCVGATILKTLGQVKLEVWNFILEFINQWYFTRDLYYAINLFNFVLEGVCSLCQFDIHLTESRIAEAGASSKIRLTACETVDSAIANGTTTGLLHRAQDVTGGDDELAARLDDITRNQGSSWQTGGIDFGRNGSNWFVGVLDSDE